MRKEGKTIMEMDLFRLADLLQDELVKCGIKFNINGYPIIPTEMYLKQEPQEILPYVAKSTAKEPKKTLLCTFSNDETIYRRLLNLERDLPVYNQFMGVCGFDLSPRINWDITLQEFNLLLNQLANAYLASKGISIMPNFRTGCSKTFDLLNVYPKGMWYAVGTLGCQRGNVALNQMYLRSKIFMTQPEKLLFYGGLRDEYKEIVEEMQIPYKVYLDFKKRCFVERS